MSVVHCINLNQTFETLACCQGGIVFAVDSQSRAMWLRDGTTFHCPNGHRQSYGETEAQKLQRQLEIKDKELAARQRALDFARENAAAERKAREHTERRLTARKGVNTRLRNRIRHGVCPCCHRTFKQLAAHMKLKHPQFNKDDGE
jgi:hypothetical protein